VRESGIKGIIWWKGRKGAGGVIRNEDSRGDVPVDGNRGVFKEPGG